jgi:hypothetical protein
MLVLMAVALFVRMWFDLAQTHLVRDNERRVLWVLLRCLGLAFRSGKLFAEYIGIGLFAIVTFGVGVGVWVYLPHSATVASFLVLEFVTIAQIASRLWLKAASARWVALLPSEPTPLPAYETPALASEVTDVQPPLPDPPYSE